MSQPITTSVTMDAESFQKFRSFDLFHHQKRWQRPLLFTAILLGSSGICLSQVGVREGASLLAVVLAIVALGLPAVYFYTFFRDLRTTIQKLGLPRPFYRLQLDDAGLSVWMAGMFSRPLRKVSAIYAPPSSPSPSAPRTPCTFTSSRPKPTSSTARSGTRCGTA